MKLYRRACRYSSRSSAEEREGFAPGNVTCYARRGAPQYSILTCTQAFAGKSVPVITLMNGNKGRRRVLRRAILCSPRSVLLRAVLSHLLFHHLFPLILLLLLLLFANHLCLLSPPLDRSFPLSFSCILARYLPPVALSISRSSRH